MGDDAIPELADEAIWLGHLVVSLLPDEPEAKGGGRAVATRSRRRFSPRMSPAAWPASPAGPRWLRSTTICWRSPARRWSSSTGLSRAPRWTVRAPRLPIWRRSRPTNACSATSPIGPQRVTCSPAPATRPRPPRR
ncbi:hypothetical protein [Sorangium sp. So ce291]|uniref:hypothetical protein n=1 Tax=Sorangium sp. So ce291 TaxID=3133294 RepID=UPI003F5D879C